MRVRCGTGEGEHWHDISPTGMVVVLEAIREGDLLTVSTTGVSIKCYKEAFTVGRVGSARVRYGPKNVIKLDGDIYDIGASKGKNIGR